MPHVTVQVQLGKYAFQGRAVESLDIRQAVGEHTECTLVFDRDPRAGSSETREVEAAALADARLQIVLAKSDDAAPGAAGGAPGTAGSAATGNANGGLFTVDGVRSAGMVTARAAIGAAVKTAITNRRGSGRVTTDAILSETGGAVGPQVANEVGRQLDFRPEAGGGAGGGSGGSGPNAGGGGAASFDTLFTRDEVGKAAESSSKGVLTAAVSAGVGNSLKSGRETTNKVLEAVGSVAATQVGRVVDAAGNSIGKALNGTGAATNGAGAAPGAQANGAPAAAGFLAFDGRVREVKTEYRADGTARFTVRAFSASYELGAHADQRYFPKQTIAGLAGALDIAVAGTVPAGAPRDYWQRGESRWAFYARAASVEGLQLRATWGRRPGESAPQPAEVAQGFADETHVVTWGRDLTEFAVVGRPTNHGVTGAFTDPATKHTHQFRGVRKAPRWLGGAKPLVAALEQAATKDAGGGDPGHVEVGGLGGTRARNLEEFRTRLERASEARLGGSVEATGASTEPGLRAGDLLEVRDGASNGTSTGTAAASWNVGAEERGGTYGLISVHHHWEHGLYKNTFTATPWAGYHPAPKAVEQSLARAAAVLGGADASGTEHAFGTPTAAGVTLATVFDDDDPKKLGRVRVQFPHQKGTDASHWLRVAGPGGGKGHGGGHVPLKGNMVAVTPVKNDDEHPLVLGAVYDQTDAGGQTKDRIQTITRSGSGLSLNTGQGGATDHVELHTPGGQAMVRLNGSLVTIHAEGDISIEAPNGEVRIHAKSMTTTVDTNVVREVTGDVHDSVQGSVTRAVKGDVNDTVQGAVMRKVTGDVNDSVKGSVVRGVKGDVHDSVQGSVVNAVKGNVNDTIQGAAKRDVSGDSSTTAANVTVASRGTMDATSTGVHTIKGGQVNIN